MKLTLGTTYYNNPDYLERFIDRNHKFVDELIVVDDGSSLPITDYLLPKNNLRIFKVTEDLGFNSHGCRNLIMSQTSNEWVVMIDVDREFRDPEYVYSAIRARNLNWQIRYRFMAHASSTDSHHSVNDYLINKRHFFSAGGYDEENRGERWGDREFFKQLLHFGEERTLYDIDMDLTRESSAKIGGLSRSKLDKKISSESETIIKRRILKPEPNKPILTFDWLEVK